MPDFREDGQPGEPAGSPVPRPAPDAAEIGSREPSRLELLAPVAAMLAEHLGVPVDDFIEVFGLAWRENDLPDTEVSTDHEQVDPAGWFVLGEPARLMARPHADGIELAVPVGEWRDIFRSVIVPTQPVLVVDGSEAAREANTELVTRLLRTRGRRFRACRYCRTPTPPEHLHDSSCCDGCAQVVWDLVY